MKDNEIKILCTFAKLFPKMSDTDKDKLLAFGEGMTFKVNQIPKESAMRQKDEVIQTCTALGITPNELFGYPAVNQ